MGGLGEDMGHDVPVVYGYVGDGGTGVVTFHTALDAIL